MRQLMLDIFLTNEEVTGSDIDVAIPTNTKNTIVRTYKILMKTD